MVIHIKVKSGAKMNHIEKLTDSSYRVEVTTTPIHNKANNAVVKLLAEYFHTKQSEIIIVKGLKSSKKIVYI